MNQLLELGSQLETLLIKEFSSCHMLLDLTRAERSALAKKDVAQLTSLVERKEVLLDELGRLDDDRRRVTQDLGSAAGLPVLHSSTHPPSVADILPALDEETAARLGRLREGILALMSKVRDLAHGNNALAVSALERAEALQSFLLSLYQPPAHYGPLGVPIVADTPLSWEFDQKT
jgi:flagellar biosynthesis/type III secretory pathway chaperone